MGRSSASHDPGLREMARRKKMTAASGTPMTMSPSNQEMSRSGVKIIITFAGTPYPAALAATGVSPTLRVARRRLRVSDDPLFLLVRRLSGSGSRQQHLRRLVAPRPAARRQRVDDAAQAGGRGGGARAPPAR